MRLLAVILAASLCAASWASAQQNGVRVATRGAQRDVAVMLDQAVILESARSFSELQIAQPGIADVQPLSDRSIYLLGRSIGRTSLALLDASGRVIENLRVVVEPDLSELKQRLRELLPRERVEVRAAGDGLILSGSVGGAAAIDRAMALGRAYAGDRVTNLMTVGAMQQVSLVVRLAEMNRTAAKEIGVSLGASRTGDPSVGVATGGTNILPGGGVDLPAYTGFGALGTLFSIGDSLLLGLQIDALETKGFARTLAEPNLVALSGGEAEFLAGGEVPIPLINNDGEVDVEFRPIGVSLAFRPTVLEDDAISIAVSSEV
ncbi:MAG: type II and III secretion system protein family protein, partial [Rubrimonas sp.]